VIEIEAPVSDVTVEGGCGEVEDVLLLVLVRVVSVKGVKSLGVNLLVLELPESDHESVVSCQDCRQMV
jgi:hypothetical protein